MPNAIGQGAPRVASIERCPAAEALGMALARARIAVGMTQVAAGRASGVSCAAIAKAEAGRCFPSVRTLFFLAMTYDTTIEAIMRDACL